MSAFTPLLVEVTWEDASFDMDAATLDDVTGPLIVRTVGWIIRDEVHWIAVAAETLDDGHHDDGYRAVTSIPRSIILEQKELTR